MLPTPDTSHVSYNRVYEPAEDSFLLLDTLSAPSETAFLSSRFAPATTTTTPSPSPSGAATAAHPLLVLEVGPGSGVVLAFLTAHAARIFGTRAVLAAGADVNRFACAATAATAAKAVSAARGDATAGLFLDAVQGDLAGAFRPAAVDVLVFNPPYVPTPSLPGHSPDPTATTTTDSSSSDAEAAGRSREPTFAEESHLLELAYAGGRDGMETTDRLLASLPDVLSPRGCAYVLLCQQNRPEEVKARIRDWGPAWGAETVGTSGKTAGWEKLQIVRVWRRTSSEDAEGR